MNSTMPAPNESDLQPLLNRLAAARTEGLIAETTERNVRTWLTEPAFADYATAVAEHIRNGKFRELDDVFWTNIPFGTGGRRGKMYPIGTNAMNDRTVGESAQGLADYLLRQLGDTSARSCVIAYDTRNNSDRFARLSASVLAGNGVRVFIFREPRSTPQLSFAVRNLKASAGIVISASHNPPSDNGFKCAWSTGGQVLPPHDAGIIRCVEAVRDVRSVSFEAGIAAGSIRWLTPDHDQSYIAAVARQSLSAVRNLRIVYTPLHGVGMTSVARVLHAAGFNDVDVVASQATPDGNFSQVANQAPNPEDPAVLREAMELAAEVKADLVLASDPDADRIAAAVPDSAGGPWVPLNGNQLAGLLAHYIVEKRRPRSRRAFVVKTLVTTEFITRIADAHGVTTIGDLPVGFKWIADAIDRYGPEHFLFGAEESLGYLAGDYARDKDAAVAGLLFAELAAELRASGKSMLEQLDELYCRYGYHIEHAVSKSRPGREGAKEIAKIMAALRSDPPKAMAGMAVTRVHDFVSGDVRDAASGRVVATTPEPRQPQVMLEFDRPGWRVVARPSGTEPKIKFYLFGVVPPTEIKTRSDLSAAKRDAATRMERLGNELESVVKQAVAL